MKYLVIFSAVFLSISLHAGCNPNVLQISRSSGFGFSSTGHHNGSVSHEVNLPLTVNGRQGCLEQKGELSFEVKEEKRELNILFPKAKFKNIQNGRSKSYLLVNKQDERLYFEVANFVCIGSEVIAVEAFEGDISKAKVLSELSFQTSMVFSTGAAARAMAQRQEALKREFGKRNELPLLMQTYLEDHLIEWSQLEEVAVSTPSVFLSTSMTSPLANLDTEFSTLVATKGACSSEFEKVMSQFLIENLSSSNDLKIKLRRNKLNIKW